MKNLILILSLLSLSLNVLGQSLKEGEYYTIFSSAPPDGIETNNESGLLETLGYIRYNKDTIDIHIAFLADSIETYRDRFEVIKIHRNSDEKYGNIVKYICLDNIDTKISISYFKHNGFNLVSIIAEKYKFNTILVVE